LPANNPAMRSKLEAPGRRQSARHSLGYSIGTTTFGLIGAFSFCLTVAAFAKSLDMHPVTPAIKAGVGFFSCVTLSCFAAIWWLGRSNPDAREGLTVGERVIRVRNHRESPVFHASQCLYFDGTVSTANYRKAIAGLVTGIHIFYLDDGEYLTLEGIKATLGKSGTRSAIVFMRAIQQFMLERNDVKEAHRWE
jgi:hypothetical protein